MKVGEFDIVKSETKYGYDVTRNGNELCASNLSLIDAIAEAQWQSQLKEGFNDYQD